MGAEMKRIRFWIVICLSFFLVLISHPLIERSSPIYAQTPFVQNVPLLPSNMQGQSELQPFEDLIKDHQKLAGLFRAC